jgi:hypothetical protein
MKSLYLFVVMMTAGLLMAASPLGRVSSSGPLTLNGKAVPATAVASLPVTAGDEIATSSSAAMIYFADKSRATIAPNSKIKLESHNASVALRIVSGSVDLKRAEGSRISLIEAARTAALGTASGRPSPPPPPKPPVPPPPKPPPPPPPLPPPPPPRSPHCPPHDPDCH